VDTETGTKIRTVRPFVFDTYKDGSVGRY
jgi:hypothetical protein